LLTLRLQVEPVLLRGKNDDISPPFSDVLVPTGWTGLYRWLPGYFSQSIDTLALRRRRRRRPTAQKQSNAHTHKRAIQSLAQQQKQQKQLGQQSSALPDYYFDHKRKKGPRLFNNNFSTRVFYSEYFNRERCSVLHTRCFDHLNVSTVEFNVFEEASVFTNPQNDFSDTLNEVQPPSWGPWQPFSKSVLHSVTVTKSLLFFHRLFFRLVLLGWLPLVSGGLKVEGSKKEKKGGENRGGKAVATSLVQVLLTANAI
jgi:hypothetical protein